MMLWVFDHCKDHPPPIVRISSFPSRTIRLQHPQAILIGLSSSCHRQSANNNKKKKTVRRRLWQTDHLPLLPLPSGNGWGYGAHRCSGIRQFAAAGGSNAMLLLTTTTIPSVVILHRPPPVPPRRRRGWPRNQTPRRNQWQIQSAGVVVPPQPPRRPTTHDPLPP